MTGGLIERLKESLSVLTPAEAACAQYFIENPTAVVNKTIAAVARESGLGSTAIVRMCQRIGFSGYAEFRFSMNRHLMSQGMGSVGGAPTDTSGVNLAGAYSTYLHRVAHEADTEQLERLASLIVKARRISIWGCNRTFESALQLSSRLLRIGVFNQVTSDPQSMDDIATILGKGDLCVVLSLNGRGTKRYPSLMNSLTSRDCDVALITMNPKSALVEQATECAVLPWISNDYSETFLEDQLVVFMYLECLLQRIAHKLN